MVNRMRQQDRGVGCGGARDGAAGKVQNAALRHGTHRIGKVLVSDAVNEVGDVRHAPKPERRNITDDMAVTVIFRQCGVEFQIVSAI